MEVVERMRDCSDGPTRSKFDGAMRLLERALALYTPRGLALSFNGGKDSTAILHLVRAALALHGGQENGHLCGMVAFYFVRENDFPEIKTFLKDTDERYGLQLRYLDTNFKDGISNMVENGNIQAFVLGTRRGDPNGHDQACFCPSSRGWPPFMRINPVFEWSYHHVWQFLRTIGVAYCSLYDEGYTSLGDVHNTTPNSALRNEDGQFVPAHHLADSNLERDGRKDKSSEKSTLTSTVGLVVIGDEILAGKVEDANTSFLCHELHQLGWTVPKVVTIRDDVEAIAREVRDLAAAHWAVITTGGIGPTPDDVTMKGVAKAFDLKVTRNRVLERRICEAFEGHVESAHLKMTETPDRECELVDMAGSNGGAWPFPIVKCRNVYMLPGVPDLMRHKWHCLKPLFEKEKLPRFQNVVFRVGSCDETTVAPALEAVTHEAAGNVEVGSYPVPATQDGVGILISLESKSSEDLDAACAFLKEQLPPGIIVREERDVGHFRPQDSERRKTR
eukprot:evm.model.scf_314EXC.14 EVM.evm.TU.scf_314EXC.14   scf_314EXC:82576-94060(-)